VDRDSKYLSDFDLCHECLEGKGSAVEELRQKFGAPTTSYLVGAGATAAEATEVVARIWADLLLPRGDRPARLQLYDGTCALQTWLNTVALNRLVSRKRNEQRWRDLIPPTMGGGSDGEEFSAEWQADPDVDEAGDSPLMQIMRVAIESAFQSCEPEDFVLLHLKHLDGLRGAELGRMFGCHESVISRRIGEAEALINKSTLQKVHQTDPWLELQWTDFLELCRSATPACFGLD
jgi:DNA-directed RNA polymerase specialized sigma24 family protein